MKSQTLSRWLALAGFIFLSFSFSLAQKKIKFGKVDIEDLEMGTYAEDPDASAVVLYHMRSAHFDVYTGNLKTIYEVHKRIKILTAAGLDHANIEIPFWEAYDERVGSIKGKTHVLDPETGEVAVYDLERSSIYEEEIDEVRSAKKFSLPQVGPGTIIEYKYRYTTNDLYILEPWKLQEYIPVRYSEVAFACPRSLIYSCIPSGNTFQMEEKRRNVSTKLGDGLETSRIYRNIPALKEEPFVASMENYRGRLDWKLASVNIPGSSYAEYSKTFIGIAKGLVEETSYGKVIKGTTPWDKNLQPLLTDLPDEPREKVATFIERLKKEIRWNENHGVFPSPRLSKSIKNQEANGAALNLLTVRGLRMMGFKAYPVLISTRSHGFVNTFFPVVNQFNHCLVQAILPEDTIQFDVTNQHGPFDMLPAKDLNGMGLEVREESARWINLAENYKYEQTTRATLKLQQDGTIKGKINYLDKGYRAAAMRSYFSTADGGDKGFVKKYYAQDVVDTEFESPSISGVDEPSANFRVEVHFETGGYTILSGDKIYFKPMLWEASEENRFKQDTRTLPVDINYPLRYRYIMTLELPEGFVIKEMPEATVQAIPGKQAIFKYQVTSVGNMAQILFDIELKKSVFSPDEYPYLRAFFDEIIARHAEQIVIIKE